MGLWVTPHASKPPYMQACVILNVFNCLSPFLVCLLQGL